MIEVARKCYVPILKSKQGEFQALRNLDAQARAGIIPLLDVGEDLEVTLLCERILKAWGKGNPIFVDLFGVTSASGPSVHPVTQLFESARQIGLSLTPVTGVSRSPSYQAAVTDVVRTDGLGCCLRIIPNDLGAGSFPDSAVSDLLAKLCVQQEETDLLVDFGPVKSEYVGGLKLLTQGLFQGMGKNAGRWRSLIFSASGFPDFLTGFPKNAFSTIIRSEWLLWVHLVELRGSIPRVPIFGDYAVAHPILPRLDMRHVKVIPNIRYAHDTEWLIVRGKGHEKGNPTQYHSLCSRLIAHPRWMGAEFSWGDTFIDLCASGMGGPGNATTWRAVGTNHHLSLVAGLVANLLET